MELIRKRAFARAGLIGNPSDGYHGKTISVILRNFANDSYLDLKLRFYIATRDVYLVVMDDMHTRIDRKFREAGIEIAFPQRDLHLRSGWNSSRAAESDSAERTKTRDAAGSPDQLIHDASRPK